MHYNVPSFVDGKPCEETNARNKTLYNPATGETIGQVNYASTDLCNRTVNIAKNAFNSWSQTTPIKRAQILFKFRNILEKNSADLAKIVTQEHGKTIEDARGSIARGIELVEHHCALIQQTEGRLSTHVSSNIDCYTFRQPLGVCAGVSPFNFPVMVPCWMLIPAIAAGNTFILKPSEQTPSAPVRLVEYLQEAGLPDGVANILHGDKETVDTLLQHRDIQTFTAVASTPVAEYIYHEAIKTGKRAHTFGGAKNHCVLMPDANIEQASQAILGAAFGSAGERCMALSVVVTVGKDTKARLLEHLVPATQKIKVDIGTAENVDMGPLINATHREKVLGLINQGVSEGANLLVDGRDFVHPTHPNGYFIGPCLFDNVNPGMSIYQEEIFGPVLVIVEADSLEDAIQLVNAHRYGNGTAIFTSNGYNARHFSEQINAGMVGINIPIPVPVANHPFGGWKESAFGDYKMHGQESINFYTKAKTVTAKWPVQDTTTNAFVMPQNG